MIFIFKDKVKKRKVKNAAGVHKGEVLVILYEN